MSEQPKMGKKPIALSLFSSAGIGDLGFRAAGFDFFGFSEIEEDRVALLRANYPKASLFPGDIWEAKSNIIRTMRERLKESGGELFLISCTAPCQGMSKNGQGTLLRGVRDGKRPKLDPRNRLIIPALDVIKALKPLFVVFENVPEMRGTIIEDEGGKLITILDLIERELKGYSGEAYDIEFADYGLPQRRSRLITVYSRDIEHKKMLKKGIGLVPSPTHAKEETLFAKKWIPVADALSKFPPLDSKNEKLACDPRIPFHRVPVLDERKYFWVSSTPPGMSAFDNQCESCGFDGNAGHGNGRDKLGVNRASRITPIYCSKCKALLPRPTVVDKNGKVRLMAGFTSAYKRMSAHLPAPTLTRNFSYACSDSKIHPSQNRVLSIAEALHLQGLSKYDYSWELKHTDGTSRKANDGLIRLMIGESVPPVFLELLGTFLLKNAT